ncbi:MAG: DUF488 family protein [Pseudohongiellaceae bacterium]
MNPVIHLRRVYEEPLKTDGSRVLVDRLWPRGQSRDRLQLDEWYRDASPSGGLRRRWHERKLSWEEFVTAYTEELDHDPAVLLPLMRYARLGPVTLLSAVRDLDHSHMPVLRDVLLEALREEDRLVDRDGLSSPPCLAEYISR